MKRYILDTNIFFNMEAGIDLGQKTEEVVRLVTTSAEEMTAKGTGEILMPPRVLEEFQSFFDDKTQPFLSAFERAITVKSPNISRISFPANVFYDLVRDIRGRSYRGLSVGEELITKAGKLMIDQKSASAKEFQLQVGPVIRSFRDRYRQATRYGFLDSLGDLDIIVLAQEQDGYLVSTDEGVVQWGRKFGVREMSPPAFGKEMKKIGG
jgi:hypothetical protein